jgi:hypothetical protein
MITTSSAMCMRVFVCVYESVYVCVSVCVVCWAIITLLLVDQKKFRVRKGRKTAF